MKKLLKKIDFSDVAILAGFIALSYGIYEKYSLADMCLFSGGLLIVGGLFFARATSKGGN